MNWLLHPVVLIQLVCFSRGTCDSLIISSETCLLWHFLVVRVSQQAANPSCLFGKFELVQQTRYSWHARLDAADIYSYPLTLNVKKRFWIIITSRELFLSQECNAGYSGVIITHNVGVAEIPRHTSS